MNTKRLLLIPKLLTYPVGALLVLSILSFGFIGDIGQVDLLLKISALVLLAGLIPFTAYLFTYRKSYYEKHKSVSGGMAIFIFLFAVFTYMLLFTDSLHIEPYKVFKHVVQYSARLLT